MKKYKVEVTEKLSRIVEQEASSCEEALELVEKRYDNEDIALDWHDKCETELKKYPYDKIIENIDFSILFDSRLEKVYISSLSAPDVKYKCRNVEDLKSAIDSYIYDNVDLKNKKNIKLTEEMMEFKHEEQVFLSAIRKKELELTTEKARRASEYRKSQKANKTKNSEMDI